MFESATIKLTAWYLMILMIISLLFSIIIYQVTSSEVNRRLEELQTGIQRQNSFRPLPNFDAGSIRINQAQEASTNLIISLIYINVFILVAAGIGSYVLARRTLRPIEEAHEAQSRFTSDASHELRTPLAVMKTELEVALRDHALSKSEMRELLTSNLEEVDKLSRLSQTLLQLSRLDYDNIEKEKLSLEAIVRQTAHRFDKTCDRIKFTAAKSSPLITGNRASIEELATILIDNALKYSPPDSLVSIRVGKRAQKAYLEITNTGEGIRAEDLPHIFDRFFRADMSRTNGAKNGYGLGLALAKKIVEIHSGELSASSAPQHATTFTVLLPTVNSSQAKDKKQPIKDSTILQT
jgi:signal transduction histidine kinase